jgi:hypothetical protein
MKKPMERCPYCERPVCTYHRSITAAMAAALIAVHRRGQGNWVYMPEFKMGFKNVKLRAALAGGDVSKLRFWGLLDPDEKRVGYYRITKAGDLFCQDQTRLPKFADVRLGKLLRLHGDPVGIQDALRQKFDYQELIGL